MSKQRQSADALRPTVTMLRDEYLEESPGRTPMPRDTVEWIHDYTEWLVEHGVAVARGALPAGPQTFADNRGIIGALEQIHALGHDIHGDLSTEGCAACIAKNALAEPAERPPEPGEPTHLGLAREIEIAAELLEHVAFDSRGHDFAVECHEAAQGLRAAARVPVLQPEPSEPMGALEIIGWISDALQQQEGEDDSTNYLERLIDALRVRGVRNGAEDSVSRSPEPTLGPFHEKVVREWVEETGLVFYYCEECEGTGDTAPVVVHELWCRLGAIERLLAGRSSLRAPTEPT